MTISRRNASEGRVDAPQPGHAVLYTRYGVEKSVILNPLDFARLNALDVALEEIRAADRTLSSLALKAQRAEASPGAPIEDADEIERLLETKSAHL